MQKRYCTCGHLVFVQYKAHNGSWRARFVVPKLQTRQNKGHLSVCPGCGSPLNINTLR